MSDQTNTDTTHLTGVSVVFYILTVANIIGNTLVILIILANRSMKSPMNYLLVNLAVADMMVGIFFTPRFLFIHLFAHHPDGLAGTIMCKLLTGGNIGWIGAASSAVSLVAISIERYFAVIHPYSTKLKLNISKVRHIVVVCWIFAMIFVIPSFFTGAYNKEIHFCLDKWPKQELWLRSAYSTLWIGFVGIIPITTMFVLYSRVIYTLWFKRSEDQVQGTQLAMLKSRKRVTKMVVTVSVVYAFCWLPNLIIHFLYESGDLNILVNLFYIVSIVFVSFNSAINPFIYTLQSQKFRRHLKELVCCRKVRQHCLPVFIQGNFLEAADRRHSLR